MPSRSYQARQKRGLYWRRQSLQRLVVQTLFFSLTFSFPDLFLSVVMSEELQYKLWCMPHLPWPLFLQLGHLYKGVRKSLCLFPPKLFFCLMMGDNFFGKKVEYFVATRYIYILQGRNAFFLIKTKSVPYYFLWSTNWW